LANEEDTLNENEVQKLTAFFDAKLQSSFQNTGGPNAPLLRIKPTITSVRRSKSGVNAVGLVVAKVPLSYGGAAVRFDLIDGSTGEAIGVAISGRRGRPWNGLQGLSALGHSRVVLSDSAKRIKRDMDLLSGS